jgi:uncharacterized protein with von Willebrand factor type A (vWA) domain
MSRKFKQLNRAHLPAHEWREVQRLRVRDGLVHLAKVPPLQNRHRKAEIIDLDIRQSMRNKMSEDVWQAGRVLASEDDGTPNPILDLLDLHDQPEPLL